MTLLDFLDMLSQERKGRRLSRYLSSVASVSEACYLHQDDDFLMIEAAGTSETSVIIYRTTQRNIRQDSRHQTCRRNLEPTDRSVRHELDAEWNDSWKYLPEENTECIFRDSQFILTVGSSVWFFEIEYNIYAVFFNISFISCSHIWSRMLGVNKGRATVSNFWMKSPKNDFWSHLRDRPVEE
jgi:hypothetical protein